MSARISARRSPPRSTACTATSPAPTTSATSSVRNRVVMTNKTPTGLNRGFGGPQVYYALERLMQRIAVELKLDPLDVIRRNLVPSGAFPYRTATGGLLDSGDYPAASTQAVEEGGLAELRERQKAARAEGKLYGIGMTAVVEPSVSNMGYITTVLTPEERRKAGPKNGAQATATISLDPGGAVSVHVSSVPQGQGHRTVVSQVVADALGLKPADIRVEHRHGHRARRLVDRVGQLREPVRRRRCAAPCSLRPSGSRRSSRAPPRRSSMCRRMRSSSRVAASARRAIPTTRCRSAASPPRRTGRPGTLAEDDQAIRETVFWTPPQLTAPTEDDGINSSLCHGFIFDFCGVEVDRVTGAVRIDKYVTMHDCGRVLHPGMVAGQVTGGFAQAVGAALYEEYAYADDGSFISGTLADYLMPTTTEVPAPLILHFESPSPFTPLGAKGVGEGNCMSTPVCIANAVADALGVAEIDLPLTPAKLAALIAEAA